MASSLSTDIETANNSLHVFFLPWYATGHLIPLVDIARIFASRGVKCTVLITAANAALIHNTIDRSVSSGLPIQTLLYPFPSAKANLPPGIENLASAPPNEQYKINNAAILARPNIESLIRLHRPNAIISDQHFVFTDEISHELNVPNVIFHALGLFPISVMYNVLDYKPHLSVSSDTEMFLVPDLPHPVYLTRPELPEFILRLDNFSAAVERMRQTEANSFGIVSNSFSAIESEYADHFYTVRGKKSWFVGPVALATCSSEEDQAVRGGEDSIHHLCLTWLDSRSFRSVVFVCFGSWCHFSSEQIVEMALGLEKCGHPFLWVVRDEGVELPPGFEKKVEGRGLVVRGWAPQVAVLGHRAVGGFLTHCGWNSTLEALSAGLPVVTWPLNTEQFINEKLLVEILRIGVKNWDGFRSTLLDEVVTVRREDIARAVKRIMNDSEEAEGMRKRAKEYGEKARESVKEGGSSYNGVNCLIEDIKAWPKGKMHENKA